MCCELRLRAALFINLVDMRDALSVHRGNTFCTLSPENLSKLQRANDLFHSALNGAMLAISAFWYIRSQLCLRYFPY